MLSSLFGMSFVREMTHAPEWYPTDSSIEQMMKASFFYAPTTPEEQQNIVGIISPHSCYTVCLRIAAKSYARINPDNYDTIVLLGTCHHLALPGCLVSDASAVKTPFGNITVNTALCHQIVDGDPSIFSFMTEAVDNAEHSLEMQYPLIKWVFKDRPISIVPILVGSLTEEREEKAMRVLKPIIETDMTVFVISSDFMHWGEVFRYTGLARKGRLESQLKFFDDKAFTIISAFNYDHFRFQIEEQKGSICGCYAIALVLHILHKGYKADMIDRAELCTLKEASDFSISYVSISFTKLDGVVDTEADDDDDAGMFPPGMDPAIMQALLAGQLK